MNNAKKINIALDGNEANVSKRVGSNVYSWQIIKKLEKITRDNYKISWTILLSSPPIDDLPKQRKNWQYKIITPKKMWTQWALPIHLFLHQKNYDIFVTTSHYAPRFSPIPYISSVMDLAFEHFPDQFTKTDLIKLRDWTRYSVKNAKKIITISNFSREDIHKTYDKKLEDIIVAYPGSSTPLEKNKLEKFPFKRKKLVNISLPYFLYLGTIQPRKNLITLIKAYESLRRYLSSQSVGKSSSKKIPIPQLVIAGKVGWLAESIITRANTSSYSKDIIITNFVEESEKNTLLANCLAIILVGSYEGFGMPILEAMNYYKMAIVANNSSLPEVVGDSGFLVNPYSYLSIRKGMIRALTINKQDLKKKQKQIKLQLQKFSWDKSAQVILETILKIAKKNNE